MSKWEQTARHLANVYSAWIDWEEQYYICPECGEPIYRCDREDDNLDKILCPICEFGENEC